jgi:Arc/MetJ-type ribon-helix-helix transcriptional regulator
MRTIINISLPQSLASCVQEEVDSGQYATKSEFFRTLLRNWLENRLVKELDESHRELKTGKGKLLKTLKDLR